MKFKEYVAMLQKELNDRPEIGEMTAIYAIDEEGNGFNEVDLDNVSIGIYDNEYGGDFCGAEEDIRDRILDGDIINSVCIN